MSKKAFNPEEIDPLYFVSRIDWRRWLAENHNTSKGVWLLYYKQHSGKPRIPYDDAVEEALCFGWIDSTIRRIDDDRYMQRFTPRRNGSRWSEPNMERAARMVESGMMQEAGMMFYQEALDNPALVIPARTTDHDLPIPEDLAERLERDAGSLDFFRSFSRSYRNICIDWINDAKRAETRLKRIEKVAEKAAIGEKIDFMKPI